MSARQARPGRRVSGRDAERGHSNAPASWVRLVVMLLAGGGVGTAAGLAGSWVYAPSAGWATACAIYVAWAWIAAIGRMDGDATKRHAMREDPSRSTSDLLLVLAAIASLAALALLLGQGHQAQEPAKALIAGLGIVSVALSWGLIHTLYTFRYAALYFGGDVDEPIDFNQHETPRYLDFAYLAFTVGMTFQVSDTDIRSSAVRSAILRHMFISYLFGAVIIASAINAVVTLAQ